jgi:hypothetical protein
MRDREMLIAAKLPFEKRAPPKFLIRNATSRRERDISTHKVAGQP